MILKRFFRLFGFEYQYWVSCGVMDYGEKKEVDTKRSEGSTQEDVEGQKEVDETNEPFYR
jgi:hypothetical protein